MRAHRDTRLCSSRQRNILLDDSSAHILRGPRKRPRGSRRSLRRKSLSAIRQLPDRTGTDDFRDLSRNGPIVRYPCTFVNPISHSAGDKLGRNRASHSRSPVRLLPSGAASGAAAAIAAAAAFFLVLSQFGNGQTGRSRKDRQYKDIPHSTSLYANADAGIRIFVSSEHQVAKACQRRQRGNGHYAEAGLPRQ